MFETAVVSQGPQTKRVWTTCLGFTGQALLIGGMLVGPLIWPQALPNLLRVASISAPPAPAPPHVAEPPRFVPRTAGLVARITHVFTEPTRVPTVIPVIHDIESSAPVVAMSGSPAATGSGSSVYDGIPGAVLTTNVAPVAPVVVTPKPAPPKAPRVTEVKMAEPIQRVNPVYPEWAKRARVSGKVELMGVLGTDGRIHELKVISGHPFLVKAAMDAVAQWVYRPTILNGQAVEVSAPITVNFILTGQ